MICRMVDIVSMCFLRQHSVMPNRENIKGAKMKTMTIECPDKLASELDEFVKEGWAINTCDTVIEAVRRFLESHSPDIISKHVRSDVEWGLHGKD